MVMPCTNQYCSILCIWANGAYPNLFGNSKWPALSHHLKMKLCLVRNILSNGVEPEVCRPHHFLSNLAGFGGLMLTINQKTETSATQMGLVIKSCIIFSLQNTANYFVYPSFGFCHQGSFIIISCFLRQKVKTNPGHCA